MVTQNSTRTFIVRVWLEDLGGGHSEWRLSVQDVTDSRVVYFRSLENLPVQIKKLLTHRIGS